MRLWRASSTVLGHIYVMFFGQGDRWSVWAVVMSALVLMILAGLTDGFAVAPTLGQWIFVGLFAAVSAAGVFVRRRRKDEQ